MIPAFSFHGSIVASQALYLSVIMAIFNTAYMIKANNNCICALDFSIRVMPTINTKSAEQKLASIYPLKKRAQDGDWLLYEN
jgi:hypothetical protein